MLITVLWVFAFVIVAYANDSFSHNDIIYDTFQGFFGRGLMSQGTPDFYKRLPNVFIPQEDGVPCPYKVVRRRM